MTNRWGLRVVDFDTALSPLRDVERVYGKFVLNTLGRPLYRDVSRIVSDNALRVAGPRIALLWANLPQSEEPRVAVLEFVAHKLYVFAFERGSLCILASSEVDNRVLQIAASRSAERLLTLAPELLSD